MTFRRLILTGLCCLAFACAKAPASGGNLGDPCAANADCNAPFICEDAHCSFDKRAVCDKGSTRCNGNLIETCDGNAGDNQHGNKWVSKNGDADLCKTGCVLDSTGHTASCKPSECSANATRCAPVEGGAKETLVQQCDANGGLWHDVFSCPTNCEVVGGQAQCASQICEPFATRCKAGGTTTLQTCNGRGTSYTDKDCNSTEACVEGRCLPVICQLTTDGTTITKREERCNGVIAEQCNNTGTAFEPKQVCNNGCDFDATNKKATCAASVCTPFTTKCGDLPNHPGEDRTKMQTCNARGTAYVDTPCGANGVCVKDAGICRPKACSITLNASLNITGRETRCTANVREQCNDAQTAFEAAEVCQFGCGLTGPGGAAACQPALCNAGDRTCGGADGNALEVCSPDRVSYDFIQYCPAGCAKDTTTTPLSAACKPTSCNPLARRCAYDASTDRSTVEICAADGTGFSKIEDCAQTCNTGFCTVTNARCTAGATRCVGSEVEACVRMDNGATEWRFQDRCLGTCGNGACSVAKGAVGCAGGANASLECGVPARQAIGLHPLLSTATETVPCDGIARVLVYSDPITSSDGLLVPDGTLVTFAHDVPTGQTPDNLLGSGDADPTTAGLQRPTLHGIAMVVIASPASCASPRTVTVTASIGGRAAGTTTVNFAAPQPTTPPTKKIYIAEDFSTARNYDRTSTAEWNFTYGAAVGLPAFNLGTGKDGDYAISDKQIHDLSAEGYARSWGVTRITGNEVQVDNVLPSLSAGDEVLLTTVWSQNAATIGQFEYRRVASVATGRVILTEAVRNVYGNNGKNDDFTDVRTIIQRVPQFNNVTIGDLTTLTTSAPTAGTLVQGGTGITGGGSGIVAFRARGIVRVLGKVDLVGKGFPTTVTAPAAPNADRLAVGRASASGQGGGAFSVSAGTFTFKDANGAAAGTAANVNVNGIGASGSNGAGTIHLKGGTFEFGTNATRLQAGAANWIRLDFGTVDSNPTASPPPAILPATPATSVLVGQNGAFTVQSTVAYDEVATVGPLGQAMNIFTTDLVGVIGGSGATTVVSPIPTTGGLQSVLKSFSVAVSADGGTTYGGSNLGRVSYNLQSAGPPVIGQKFRWRAFESTLEDKPVYLRGIAFRVNLAGQ